MEAWRRLDPRITWLVSTTNLWLLVRTVLIINQDIVMRMERASTTDKKAANNLNVGNHQVFALNEG